MSLSQKLWLKIFAYPDFKQIGNELFALKLYSGELSRGAQNLGLTRIESAVFAPLNQHSSRLSHERLK